MGDRPGTLEQAVGSLSGAPVVVVWNGTSAGKLENDVRSITAESNLGVPGGRDLGIRASDAEIVGFLDDDAVASEGASGEILAAFAADDDLGVVALRLVDENGQTSRRHAPRLGPGRPDVSGDVALFLGGACAIRRAAYDDAGGYFTDLFYGHEELELSWRLVDQGWTIRYLAGVTVFHPRGGIGRHADGWSLTGRNRVLVARRTLPWLVAVPHALVWVFLGAARARGFRGAYLGGWRSGWRIEVDRRPISWRTVWRLTRLGRPPIV